MEIKTLRDPAFRTYGRVIKGYDTKVLEEAMAHTPLPEDVVYVASVPELEALAEPSNQKELEFAAIEPP